MDKKNQKRLNVTLEIELHKQLKIAATKQEMTIANFVVQAIKEKIERERTET